MDRWGRREGSVSSIGGVVAVVMGWADDNSSEQSQFLMLAPWESELPSPVLSKVIAR